MLFHIDFRISVYIYMSYHYYKNNRLVNIPSLIDFENPKNRKYLYILSIIYISSKYGFLELWLHHIITNCVECMLANG